MQAVLDEELDDDLLSDLQPSAEGPVIRIGRCAVSWSRILGQCFLHPERRGVNHAGLAFGQAHGSAESSSGSACMPTSNRQQFLAAATST